VIANGGDMDTPVFIRADSVPAEMGADWALGGKGWGILGSSRRPGKTAVRTETESRQQLCGLVCRLLSVLSRGRELRDVETLIVDDRLGQELPTNASELLESAVRLDVPRVSFEDKSISLSESARAELEMQARVRLGNAVAGVDLSDSCATITYKRGLPAITVPKEVGSLLTKLGVNPSLAELASRIPSISESGDLLLVLRALEESRLVYLSFPEASCIAAGIS